MGVSTGNVCVCHTVCSSSLVWSVCVAQKSLLVTARRCGINVPAVGFGSDSPFLSVCEDSGSFVFCAMMQSFSRFWVLQRWQRDSFGDQPDQASFLAPQPILQFLLLLHLVHLFFLFFVYLLFVFSMMLSQLLHFDSFYISSCYLSVLLYSTSSSIPLPALSSITTGFISPFHPHILFLLSHLPPSDT